MEQDPETRPEPLDRSPAPFVHAAKIGTAIASRHHIFSDL
jgi:hypothetical protein